MCRFASYSCGALRLDSEDLQATILYELLVDFVCVVKLGSFPFFCRAFVERIVVFVGLVKFGSFPFFVSRLSCRPGVLYLHRHPHIGYCRSTSFRVDFPPLPLSETRPPFYPDMAAMTEAMIVRTWRRRGLSLRLFFLVAAFLKEP